MSYTEYIRSEQWAETKRRFKASKLFKGRCECCLSTKVPLDIHHKTYKRLGKEKLMDLVALCPICHAAAHLTHESNRRDGLWKATKDMTKRLARFMKRERMAHLRNSRPTEYLMWVAMFFKVKPDSSFVSRAFR